MRVRRAELALARTRSYHDACATVVQRWFRGYHSRKHKQDYYARKKWVRHISEKAELIQQELARFEEDAYHVERAAQEAKDAEQFEAATENLHHLISTHVTPGVFKSVLGEQYDATAYEIPLEQHLKDSFRNHLVKTGTRLSTMGRVRARFASSMAEPVLEDTTNIFPAGSVNDPYAPLPPPHVVPPQHAPGAHKTGLYTSVAAKVHSSPRAMHTHAAPPHALASGAKTKVAMATAGKPGAGIIPKHARQKRVG